MVCLKASHHIYYTILIIILLLLLASGSSGLASLIKQCTCISVGKSYSQVIMVAFANICILFALCALIFSLIVIQRSNHNSSPDIVSVNEVPAMIGLILVIVATALFARSSMVSIFLNGPACGQQVDQKTVRTLDIIAACTSGCSIAMFMFLIFRPFVNCTTVQ